MKWVLQGCLSRASFSIVYENASASMSSVAIYRILARSPAYVNTLIVDHGSFGPICMDEGYRRGVLNHHRTGEKNCGSQWLLR